MLGRKVIGRLEKSDQQIVKGKLIGINAYRGLIKPSKPSNTDKAFAENINPASADLWIYLGMQRGGRCVVWQRG